MKKISIIILTLAALVAFCACGETDIRGEIKNNDVPETSVQTSADTASAETEAETVQLEVGETEGSVYQNSLIGIGYNLEEGWSFYSDEQINELNNITSDMLPEEAKKALEDATVVYDMYAKEDDGLNSIIINFEKINLLQTIAIDLLENFEQLVPTLRSTYENMGYTNFTYDICYTAIEDENFASVKLSAEINGISVYQTMLQKKCGGYLATISATAYYEDTTGDILDNFFLLK